MTFGSKISIMKECRYCKKPIKEEDAICVFCGFDHTTGMISSNTAMTESQKKAQIKVQKAAIKSPGIDPRVKKFAFIGLAIVIFSIFYKYNFDINNIMSEAKHLFTKLTMGKSAKGKNKTSEKIELINIKSFEATKKTKRYKDVVVEGVFFDPNGKSFVTVNGNVLSQGESAGNITVKEINKNSVELIVDGKSRIIEVENN